MGTATRAMKQIAFLDNLLRDGNSYTVKELTDKLNQSEPDLSCSEKTVYRRLRDLRTDYSAKIKTVEGSRKKYDEQNTVMLPSYITKAENFRFIKVIDNLLATIKNSPIYEDAEKAMDELYKFTTNVKSGEDSASCRVIFMGAPASKIKDDVYDKIYKAMEKNNQIVIEYPSKDNDGNNIIKKRGVHPYQLIYDNGTWDLWALDNSGSERKMKLFNLAKIESVEISKENFTLKNPFPDFKLTTPGTFGTYTTKDYKDYELLIKKGEYVESFIKDKEWGNDQIIEEKEDGTHLSFSSNQEPLILRWVLGWGKDIIPLKPDSLVKDWKTNVKEMINAIKNL